MRLNICMSSFYSCHNSPTHLDPATFDCFSGKLHGGIVITVLITTATFQISKQP